MRRRSEVGERTVPAAIRGWFRRSERPTGMTVGPDPAAASDQPARECSAGDKVQVLGTLRTVELRPAGEVATLVAELYDGTDSIDLVWLGRRAIAGIDAGRRVRVTGRIASRDGHKAMYNPRYELLPEAA